MKWIHLHQGGIIANELKKKNTENFQKEFSPEQISQFQST
jgi:hypothetical protein